MGLPCLQGSRRRHQVLQQSAVLARCPPTTIVHAAQEDPRALIP